ncbi:MAG: tetraacyldisaccharide 4'-kinase [Alphaproteobacteria bacterium]|nr:tetraacyldisaccharide 4'-kinase [Alphaproteobacteria bacterium]
MTGLKTPSFWYEDKSWQKNLLGPIALIYQAGRRLARAGAPAPYQSPLPVLCLGNLTAGGSGKTPAAIALMKILQEKSLAGSPCFLTRGYGGTERGPVRVDPARHTAVHIGDEPLLLARHAPVIVARDRPAGARLAAKSGIDVIVMDDGFQNPSLEKTLSLVVIDGDSGFGNQSLLPAGPLREPLSTGFARADGFILIGADRAGVIRRLPPEKPIFRAQIVSGKIRVSPATTEGEPLPYFAFTGLGRPEKLRKTLESQGITLAAFQDFPDHHRYTARDLRKLQESAARYGARLITTEKDVVKLPPEFATDVLPIRLDFDDEKAVTTFLKRKLTGLI